MLYFNEIPPLRKKYGVVEVASHYLIDEFDTIEEVNETIEWYLEVDRRESEPGQLSYATRDDYAIIERDEERAH